MPHPLEIVTVGDEMLLGQTVDTNSTDISSMLLELGIPVSRQTTVGDTAAEIGAAVVDGLSRTGCVIVTGGLGPTSDDLTREAVATALGIELHLDAEVWQALQRRWEKTGRAIAETNKVQAMVPENAVVLENRLGSAPGLWIESQDGLIVLLPGVPTEVRGLMVDQVLPRMRSRFGEEKILFRQLRTAGISESKLAELLAPIETRLRPVELAYLPQQAGVDLRLTVRELSAADANKQLELAEEQVRGVVGQSVYGEGKIDLAEVVLKMASAGNCKLAVAESCTGGMIATRLTDIPGSSASFVGGVVAYSNELKEELLRVPKRVIDRHGAVSAEVAEAMAVGAVECLGVDVAISVTGIAGPTGGTVDKPVGTVWLGWSSQLGSGSRRMVMVGDRRLVRIRTTQAALLMLWRLLVARQPSSSP